MGIWKATVWGRHKTPKAFANFSPGFELARTLGMSTLKCVSTLKGFANRGTLSGFIAILHSNPGFSLRFEPWAEISERLRRNFN